MSDSTSLSSVNVIEMNTSRDLSLRDFMSNTKDIGVSKEETVTMKQLLVRQARKIEANQRQEK